MEPPVYGFVFAFCEFSRLGHPSLMERAVRAVSRSDSIHVAVVPAALDRAVRRVGIVGEAAYTAFMGCGVVAQPVDQVLTRCYCYSFLPVRGGDAALFRDGVRFLRGMVGVRYNRLSLLSTLLPPPLSAHIPAWVSCEGRDFMPRPDGPAVFCSQLGLMLCYRMGSLPASLDPASCSPCELERIIGGDPRSLRVFYRECDTVNATPRSECDTLGIKIVLYKRACE
jgi:hypothetical protein